MKPRTGKVNQKKQESVYANINVFEYAEQLAKENSRSKSYYLTKFLVEGAKLNGYGKVNK